MFRTPADAVSINLFAPAHPSVVGHSQRLPFFDGTFSGVLFNGFPCTELDPSTLAEAARVTRPGGVLSITTGRKADVAGIVGELERLGCTTWVTRMESDPFTGNPADGAPNILGVRDR